MSILGKPIQLQSVGMLPPYVRINSVSSGTSNVNVTLVGFSVIPAYFMRGNSGLTTINLEDCAITSIGDQAFSMTKVSPSVFGDTVEYVGSSAFNSVSPSNTSLLTMPKLKRVEESGFRYCRFVTVDLGSDVEYLGDYAFAGSGNIQTFIIRAITPPELYVTWTGGTRLFYRQNSLANIYVPAQSVDAYKSADGWSNYASKISAIPT